MLNLLCWLNLLSLCSIMRFCLKRQSAVSRTSIPYISIGREHYYLHPLTRNRPHFYWLLQTCGPLSEVGFFLYCWQSYMECLSLLLFEKKFGVHFFLDCYADYSLIQWQEVAQKIGEMIAKSCLEKGITKVAFDRGGYPYHGRVKALADAAREHGLVFWS